MIGANAPTVQEYVSGWAKANDAAVTEEAISNNLVPAFIVDPTAGNGIGDEPTKATTAVALGAAEHLTTRMLADMNRSRDLFLEYTQREKARLHKSLEENVDDAVRRFEAEAAGKLAVNQMESEYYQEFLDTLRVACIRPNPPELRATIFISPSGTNTVTLDSSSNPAAEPRYSVSLQTHLTVNPVFYPGDPDSGNGYRIVCDYLNAADVTNAIASGNVQGHPLLPGTVAALKYVLDGSPAPAPGREQLLVGVVSAYSKTMADFSKITLDVPGLREAVANLPGRDATEQTADGHLMAQSIAYGLVPLAATGHFSGDEIQSTARTVKVRVTITDTNANPPGVTTISGIVIVLEGQSKKDAFEKKAADYRKRYPGQEVTIEEQ